MRNLPPRFRALSLKRPAFWVSMPLSLGVGFGFYLATASSIHTDATQRFNGHAQTARNTIVARVKSYTDVVRSTAALFQSNYPLSRLQFHRYVNGIGIEKHFPAIEGINYAEFVTDAQRPEFERRMASEPMADGSAPQPFVISPPGRRENYNIMTMIEPIHLGNAMGRDMTSIPYLYEQHMRNRDSGLLTSSGRPIDSLSGPNRTGLAMRLAIYHPDKPTATVEQRRAAFIGSVGLAFSVNKLMTGVIDEMPVKNARMILVDRALGIDRVGSRVLFDSTGSAPPKPQRFWLAANRFSRTLPIDFNGRQWDATFSVDAREMYSGFEEFAPWLAMMAGSVSTLLFYALFHTLTSSRARAIKLAKVMTRELRESQAKLQMSHQNLRRLAAHADQIKEGERKRIAREIHDDLGQNLLALRIDADMLSTRTRVNHPRLHHRASATLAHIDTTIKSVRQIINDLRPNVLDLGLSAAVEWQIGEFRRRTGIDCELVDESNDVALDEQAAIAFFRILQESLSNIVRHAHASRVKVVLSSRSTTLAMTVSDNGVGLGQGGRSKVGSFGLVGIEERISILDGTFSILSKTGEGTTVSVSVPITTAPPTAVAPAAAKSTQRANSEVF